MTGYRNCVDPSYYGQIVTMTYPLIGNYGVNSDQESSNPKASGFVVREYSSYHSNWRSQGSFGDYLKVTTSLVFMESILGPDQTVTFAWCY